MSSYSVPSGHGYVEIPLDQTARKPLKSVQIYQAEEALNVDLEFEDNSMLEMIFRVGFHASVKLLDHHDGNYTVRKRIKPLLLPK